MGKTIAVIGGTGVGELLSEFKGSNFAISTSYGELNLKEITLDSNKVILIKRHGTGHKVPPHKVPYKAFASALQTLKVDTCFSTAAVGSLQPDWSPGTLVVCKDFIDFSARNITLYEKVVKHVDFTDPFPLHSFLVGALDELGISSHQGIYGNMNGPRYETPAEIRAFSTLGIQIVGMTAGSEAIVMREAGIKYGCLAIVTNLAAGLSTNELSHAEVKDVMVETGPMALKVIFKAISGLGD